ncbi:hypothetical protein Bpfe_001657 [Biomphalaria pfeifferi]|uniref:Uncharacterized protein n=1 Tax=Biomphalaria pfeifferi TaxID=112525 RepID=A0AAD8CAH5_BIOPF|nr:hypothetical protein Bpfe_001657 [Biomphalaria pfeifferi]
MSSKRKSKTNRTRLRLLTPIKEVSGLVPVEIIPYGSKTVRISDPIKPILVKVLPAESPRDVRLKERAPNVNGPVDNIVEEYLTQARQSNIIPSPYNFGTRYYNLRGDRGLLCPCCANRNRESFEKKAALQRGKDISSIRVLTPPEFVPDNELLQQPQSEAPTHHSKPISLHPPLSNSWDVDYLSDYPANTYHRSYIRTYPFRCIPLYQEPPVKPFSRKASAQRAYIRGRVVEANSKYHESMHKLQVHFEKNYSIPELSITDSDED